MDPTTITTTTFTVTGPGVTPVAGAVAFSGVTATFTPTASLAASTLYTATITTGAKNVAEAPLAAAVVWTFTTGTIPKLYTSNPLPGATALALNRKIAATFSEPMTPATVTAPGTFTVAVAGAGGAAVPGTVTYVAATNTAMFTPTANLAASTQYTATINMAALSSAAGNSLAANYVFSFTTGTIIDSTPPQVTLTLPASAATAVPINDTITATFSKALDSSTITAPGTFTVAVAGGGATVPGTVNYAGNTATFTPTAPLTATTQYTATITPAATKDLAGNALVAAAVPTTWSFTTGAVADTTAPTITLAVPATAGTNDTLNLAVSATFSKAMNPATILAPGTFSVAVAGVGGAAVPGNVTYNSTNNIATFTPTANLTATTQYTATISTAAKDLAGNALAAGTPPNPWSFTTGASLSPIGPTLASSLTFGVLGTTGAVNTGLTTAISGNLGSSGASTVVTGFNDAGSGCTYTETGANVGVVHGLIYTGTPPPTGCPTEGTTATLAIATQANTDATAAYANLVARTAGVDPGTGQLGGLTLLPATYTSTGGSFTITGTDLTLNAAGDANAVWIFQMSSSLTVGATGLPRNVILENGAQAKNVFWQVGTTATINAAGGGTFVGTIISTGAITISGSGNTTATTINGRVLAPSSTVTMADTVINVPNQQ